jgi:tetratricopeptide (TPR) repeat protein
MTSTHLDSFSFENEDLTSNEGALWDQLLKKFNRVITGFVFFNFLFLIIATVEVAFFLSFFASIGESAVLAFTLAIFFLTLFSYFVLRLYFQTKKPEEIHLICEEYLNQCKLALHYQEGIPEHHLALANAAAKLALHMDEKEYTYYAPPFFLSSLGSTMEKFSAFCHWHDFHRLKEILLAYAINEHIKVVKCEPTNLQVHAGLANAYVTLSRLYADPSKSSATDEEKWLPPERISQKMRTRFRVTAERAIEEFKILNDYAPEDPWVHMQLAFSYHDLQMPEQEIQEYETILKLRPTDRETLFKLGILYFQQGKNAEGLRIYEKLKESNYKKAESLIKFYGTFEV